MTDQPDKKLYEQLVAASQQQGDGEEELVWADQEAMVVTGTAKGMKGWYHYPAHLELLAMSDDLLTQAARLCGIECDFVEWVRVARVKGKRIVYAVPLAKWVEDAIQVTRVGSSAFINLIQLMGPANLKAPKGYRTLHEVELAKDKAGSPAALKIDLKRVLDKKLEPVAKKKTTTTQPETSPGQPTT